MQSFLETMLPFITVLILGGSITIAVWIWLMSKALLAIRKAQSIKESQRAFADAADKNMDAIVLVINDMIVNPHRYESVPEALVKELYAAREAAVELRTRR